jgi:hypothetical protein
LTAARICSVGSPAAALRGWNSKIIPAIRITEKTVFIRIIEKYYLST